MSIAVAEVLLEASLPVPYLFSNAFTDAFKRDQINGYARGFQRFLEEVVKEKSPGQVFLDRIKPDSERNGAAMRSVPIGVLYTPELTKNVAIINASLTHKTPKGIASSIAVALLSHNALYYRRTGLEERTIKNWISPIDKESAEHYLATSKLRQEDLELLFGRDKQESIREGFRAME